MRNQPSEETEVGPLLRVMQQNKSSCPVDPQWTDSSWPKAERRRMVAPRGHAAQLSSCPLGLSSVNSVQWYSRRHRSQKQWDPEMDYLIGWIYLYKDRILEEEKSRGGGIVGEHQAQYGDKGEWLTFRRKQGSNSQSPARPSQYSPMQANFLLPNPSNYSSLQILQAIHLYSVFLWHWEWPPGRQWEPCVPLSLSSCHPLLKMWSGDTFKFLLKCPGSKYMNCLLLEAL